MFVTKKKFEDKLKTQTIINSTLLVMLGEIDAHFYKLDKQVDELREDVDYLLESLEDYLD